LTELASIAAVIPNLFNPKSQNDCLQNAVADCWDTVLNSVLNIYPQLESSYANDLKQSVDRSLEIIVNNVLHNLDHELAKANHESTPKSN